MVLKTFCFLLAVLNYGATQNLVCNSTENVERDVIYTVNSPGYPNNYAAGVQCRWLAICPAGYRCRLYCSDIDIPANDMCSVDRLSISRTGDTQFTSANSYCGRGTLTVTSVARRLAIGLSTSTNSPGGRFLCQLSAVR